MLYKTSNRDAPTRSLSSHSSPLLKQKSKICVSLKNIPSKDIKHQSIRMSRAMAYLI